jgi:hypothetical protein
MLQEPAVGAANITLFESARPTASLRNRYDGANESNKVCRQRIIAPTHPLCKKVISWAF